MFTKNKKQDSLDAEKREQYQYALARIKQKKRLMQHFIVFLVGSVLLIIIDPVLGIGKDFFIKNWFVWVIFLWAFLLLVHVLNVFFMNRFMGKEWEDKQLQKLKFKQEKRIFKLQKKVENELHVSEIKKNKVINQILPEDQ